MKSDKATVSQSFEHAARAKPAADEWHMLVGMAVGIDRDFNADEELKARAPDAVKAFSLAVSLLVKPYVGLQKDIRALDAGDERKLSAAFNTGFGRMGVAAMLLADVANDIAPALPPGEERRLLSLGSALNMTAQKEATGCQRVCKCDELLRYGRKLGASL